MKRRDRRALERKGEKHKSREKQPPKWLVIASITAGLFTGFCFWYFVSRCGGEHCFYNYFPLGEMLCSVLLFGAFPYIFYSNEK
jgi:hypothetical protein